MLLAELLGLFFFKKRIQKEKPGAFVGLIAHQF